MFTNKSQGFFVVFVHMIERWKNMFDFIWFRYLSRRSVLLLGAETMKVMVKKGFTGDGVTVVYSFVYEKEEENKKKRKINKLLKSWRNRKKMKNVFDLTDFFNGVSQMNENNNELQTKKHIISKV